MLTTLRAALRNEYRALRSAYRHYRHERTRTPLTMAEQALALLTIERQRHAGVDRLRHDNIEQQVRRLYEASRFVTKQTGGTHTL